MRSRPPVQLPLLASPANPQYAGGALITSLTPFGTADGGSAATVLIACNLDRDWKVYRA